MEIMTLPELCDRVEREERERARSKRWGAWSLLPADGILRHDLGYEVYVDEMADCGQMLDWIFQVRDKTWATPEVVFDFLHALNDILQPQAHYCSGGSSRIADPKLLIRRFCHKANR